MKENHREYQICTRCMMDTSDPWISFNDKGECNHCVDFMDVRIQLVSIDNKNKYNSKILSELVENIKIKAKNSKYDCVIGLSGGVDSSYTAYIAVKHGLRVLGVHLDNGWNSPVAVKNINNITSNLGIDYVTYIPPWNEFREVQLAFLEASVPEAETPTDIAILKAIYSYAAKENVPFVISGGNISGEGILPVCWHYNARDTKYSYSILESTGHQKNIYSSIKYGFFDEFYHLMIKRIKTYHLLNYISYDKNEARKFLITELGWEDYYIKHGESRYTKFIQTYYLYVKHNIDYRRATLSSELCLRLTDRESALELLSELPYDDAEINHEIDYVAKKFNITRQRLENIINAPPKWYVDYDNNMRTLGAIYDVYRKVYGKKKATNF
jgi:N-acetyl sugar amidotransferase